MQGCLCWRRAAGAAHTALADAQATLAVLVEQVGFAVTCLVYFASQGCLCFRSSRCSAHSPGRCIGYPGSAC
jgi:hypothetical protein